MTGTPFQPERLDASVSPKVNGTGLNTEFANLIQGRQIGQVGGLPNVTSADGSQLVIPPIGDTSKTGTNTQAAVTTDAPGTKTTTQPATTADAKLQNPPSVADDPNLVVPLWQRFSQNAVSTDGTLLPASGPGSPGDSGNGPIIPMWMRMAPMEMQPQLQKEIAAHYGQTTPPAGTTDQTGDPTATDQTATATTDQTAVAQTDTTQTQPNPTATTTATTA